MRNENNFSWVSEKQTLKFVIPGRIITCQLGYSRSNFKKQKREMIKVVSTTSGYKTHLSGQMVMQSVPELLDCLLH